MPCFLTLLQHNLISVTVYFLQSLHFVFGKRQLKHYSKTTFYIYVVFTMIFLNHLKSAFIFFKSQVQCIRDNVID